MLKIKSWLRKIRDTILVWCLSRLMNRTIKDSDLVDRISREYGYENNQHFLDWQDELNKISVR